MDVTEERGLILVLTVEAMRQRQFPHCDLELKFTTTKLGNVPSGRKVFRRSVCRSFTWIEKPIASGRDA
jgi:hypothetical protein